MKKIYLYTMFAAAFLAACSEFEPDHSALSNKEICFKVCTIDQSAENGSRAVTDSISGFQEPIKAKSGYYKPMYMYPLVSKTADVVDELKSSSRVTLYTENNLSNFGVVAFRRASSASIANMAPNFIYDAEVAKNGDKWTTSERQFWPMNSDVLDFYAYAPYQGAGITLSPASATGVPTITYDASSQLDLITATATNQALTVTGTGVPLTFNHALTTIKFEKSDELPGTITSISIKKVYNSGKLTFGGGWSFAGITRSDVAATEGVAMTMIPQQFSDSEQLIEVVYNDGESSYTLSYPLSGSSWVAGTTVTYVIAASALKLSIGSISFPSLKTNLPKQSYNSGDEAGLYVADASGNLIHSNVKITYNGSKWTIPSSINLYYEAGYSFFAYYPYKTDGLTPTTNITSAPTFFATGIGNWTILSNQSTSANFVSSDLQVAKGTISLDARAINFTMTHAVGLAYINLGTKSVNVYNENRLSIDANYRWTNTTGSQNVKASSSFSGNTPYPITSGTKYVAVVKAGTATSFSATGTDSWSQSCNVAANSSYTYTVQSSRTSIDNSTSYTLQVGDILYSDGGFSHQSESLRSGKTPVAIVFMATTNANSPVTTAKDRKANANWKHGYAMALKNVHSSGSTVGTYKWANSNSDVSGIPNTSSVSSDMDGYSNTTYLNSSSYPAGYAAKTTYASQATAPSNSSGWFLPSTGQWYNISSNLGSTSATLNSKLSKVGSGNYESFGSNDYYWSSSERSSSSAYDANFYSGGSMRLYDSGKSGTRRVRAVLAF